MTEIAELQIPVVILRIDDENDFTITRELFDSYAPNFKYDRRKDGGMQLMQHFEAKLSALATDSGFSYESIGGMVDMTQTRTQEELDNLPEWGSF